MATWYINPSHTYDGDGTTTGEAASAGAVGAHNTWNVAGELAWIADATYLQARGTAEDITVNIDPSNGSTLGAYGEGANPIINGNGSLTELIYVNVRNNIIIDGFTFTGISNIDNAAFIGIDKSNYVEIKNCEFKATEALGRGIELTCRGNADDLNAVTNISIHDNVFNGIGQEAIIFLNSATLATGGVYYGVLRDVDVYNNRFTDCDYGIRLLQDDQDYIDDLHPIGFRIYGNTLVDCIDYGINQITWAADQVTFGKSCIDNNTLINTGDATSTALNAIQTHRCKNGSISNNYVKGVHNPGTGDGHCIILDYGYSSTDSDYFCQNVLVEGNYCSTGTTSEASDKAAGIKVWKAINCIVRNNIMVDCMVGIGQNNDDTTDNVAYNNTIVDCNLGAIMREGNAADMPCHNNLIIDTTGAAEGFSNDGTVAALTESHNLVYGVLNNDITLDGSDIEADPLLDSNHAPQSGSPCIGAGIAVLDNRDFNGAYKKSNSNDMGAIWFDAHDDSTEEPTLLASGAKR